MELGEGLAGEAALGRDVLIEVFELVLEPRDRVLEAAALEPCLVRLGVEFVELRSPARGLAAAPGDVHVELGEAQVDQALEPRGRLGAALELVVVGADLDAFGPALGVEFGEGARALGLAGHEATLDAEPEHARVEFGVLPGGLVARARQRGAEGLVDEHRRDPADTQAYAARRKLEDPAACDHGSILEQRDLDDGQGGVQGCGCAAHLSSPSGCRRRVRSPWAA